MRTAARNRKRARRHRRAHHGGTGSRCDACTTHRAHGGEVVRRDEAAVDAEEEDAEVGEDASHRDDVVHVRTRHLDVPAARPG